MGTTIHAILDDGQDPRPVERYFEIVERRCSRFDPDSALSRLNADPRRVVEVPEDLGAVLEAAAELRDRTGGLVDIGVGAAVTAWGYDRSFTEMAHRGRIEVVPARRRPRWRIDGRVLVRDKDVRLDLGGIAKGWTCDRVVEAGLAALVSAGGDIRSDHPEAEVDILDPWGAVAATVRIGRGALATSSRTRRCWRTTDGEAHHLIDPRTGAPSDTPVLSATACTATAVEAEAAAKAILLRGEDGLAWADRQPWIRSALVVWHDGSVYATHGWEMAA